MKNVLQPVTLEEFERLCRDGKRRELVRGEVRELMPTKSWHGSSTGAIHVAIGAYAKSKKLGRVFAAETGFVIERDPDTLRAPDCAFIRSERLPSPLPNEFLTILPDLAVETLSGDDRPREIREKIAWWLENGVPLVWLVDPVKKTVTAHRTGADPRVLKIGDHLDGEEILPGFRLPVAEIFQ
ncbi:MAG: Uma2 family endonuclease [Planctomycetes bacterium]|nr:Uma2 family endonuclease [Planctomycetota bacterium]